MIRPAERFTVNIVRHEPVAAPSLPRRIATLPTVVVLAGVLGIGLGGILPAAWSPGPQIREAALPLAPAAIEPAAGPPALDVGRAPDRAFYAPVTLDAVPVTVRLAPEAPSSALTPADAGRLGADAGDPGVPVAALALGPLRLGQILLPVGPAALPASVLGADILERAGVVTVEGDRLRITPR